MERSAAKRKTKNNTLYSHVEAAYRWRKSALTQKKVNDKKKKKKENTLTYTRAQITKCVYTYMCHIKRLPAHTRQQFTS